MKVVRNYLTTGAIGLGVFALILSSFAIVPAYARGGDDDENEDDSSKVEDSEHGTEIETEDESNDDSTSSHRGSSERKLLVEEKRKELNDRLKVKAEKVREKLSGKRLELCEKRETRINTVLQNSQKRAAKVLAHLQNVESRVREYYTDKKLTVENYDALSSAIDSKEAAAVAAIDVVGSTKFSCSDDDATKPGLLIKTAVQAEHAALKSYRDAIHDLIVAIMKTQGANEKEAQ